MIISILGGVFSALIIWPANVTYGFTLTLIFSVWFIASVVNFTHADNEEALDIHNSKAHLKK